MASAHPPAADGASPREALHRLAALLAHVDGDMVSRHYAGMAERHHTGGAHDLAWAGLKCALADLRAQVDGRLDVLFREYVGVTVHAVSPLVVSACRIEGVDLDETVEGLRYRRALPAWFGRKAAMSATGWRGSAGVTLAGLDAPSVLRAFQRYAVILRDNGAGAGGVGIRAGSRCLELAFRSKGITIVTRDGRATLTVDRAMPETMPIALRGRVLDEVADLRLTNGRGYRISGVRARPGRPMAITFDAQPVQWRLPWARRWIRGADACARPDGG